MKKLRLLGLLAAFALMAAFSLPVAAEDYDTVIDGLSRLQALAQQYADDNPSESFDPIELTLSYTRTETYNTPLWQMTAGVRDPEFDDYVEEQDPDLVSLQGLGSVETSAGSVDFGHLLASINLVYRGLPVVGSWGGDCVELAQQYAGQASDAAGYAELMSGTFEDENSTFGGEDLRADLDAVIIGAGLTQGGDVAQAVKDYYSSANEYDRAYQFIALTFGDVNTGNTTDFANEVYHAATQDTGMQLLFYMNNMWSMETWSMDENYAPAVRGASDLLAEYLAGAVNGEHVRSENENRLVAMGAQALADALSALGDSDAASAALDSAESTVSSTASSTSDVLTGATQTLQTHFNVKLFMLVLLIVAAVAIFFLIMSCALFVSHRRGR